MPQAQSDEDIILQDALRSATQLQSTFRTVKDYIDLYEAAGCPRELLVKRITGVPSFRLSSSAKRRRRRESVAAGEATSPERNDQEGETEDPPRYHIAVPRDPLPCASVQCRSKVVLGGGTSLSGGAIVEKRVDLEATLEKLRLTESAPYKERWLQQVHEEGRASDIVRTSSAQPHAMNATEREVYLTLKRPDGRRTKFEAIASERSLARPVAVTLQRRNPTNCHRSQHYPTAPSSARLEKLPFPDRPKPPVTLSGQTTLSSPPPSRQPSQSGSPSKSPSTEVQKWRQHMGLVTTEAPLYTIVAKDLDLEKSAQDELLKSVASLLRI